MKTAISLPDPLFKEAEAAAKDLGLSRNLAQLYTGDRRILQRQIGRVSDQLMATMDDALRQVLAL